MRCRQHRTIELYPVYLLTIALAVVGFLVGFFATYTYAKYATTNNDVSVTLSVNMPHYMVVFDANGGEGTMEDQEFVYGTSQRLTANGFTSNGDSFLGWNTKADGSGMHYADEAEVINLATSGSITLYAEWEGGSLRTIFRLDGPCTFGGNNGVITGDNCIDYKGNNYAGMKYIDTGVLLYDEDNYDADYEIGFTIDNYVARDNVTQATFVNSKDENQATGYPGLAVRKNSNNIEVTQTINGVKVSKTFAPANGMSIVIKRVEGTVYYSVNGGSFEVLQSMSNFDDYFDITTWFGAASDANGNPMRVIVGTLSNMYIKSDGYVGTRHTVTFDAQNGTAPKVIHVKDGKAIGGQLPADPVRESEGDIDYYFAGWFTSNGERVTENYVVTEDLEVVARWRESNTACKIGDVEYDTLQEAITAAGSDGVVTIELLRDTGEHVTIAAGQKIVFDLHDYIMHDDNVQNKPIINNFGEVTITNGILTSDKNAGVFDNNPGGILRMGGGQIIATGPRQAIYNNGGYVEISGDAYLSASTSERATVQNLNNGTLEIKGGTIISANQEGVKNESGTVVIGVADDASIGGSMPIIRGATYGVNALDEIEFYDGVLQGITAAISDENMIAESEPGAVMAHSTVQVNGITFNTLYYATE